MSATPQAHVNITAITQLEATLVAVIPVITKSGRDVTWDSAELEADVIHIKRWTPGISVR